MIELRRAAGQFARVGHRGAPALAPENTLASFERAVGEGCDTIELDVLPLRDGTLIVAHSGDLREVTHGRARGRVGRRTLTELRAVAPDLPTLDEALAFFAERLTGTALQLDLKRRGVEPGVVSALRSHSLLERAWVSGFAASSLRAVAALEPGLARSLTMPRQRLGLPERSTLVRAALAAARASLPDRLPGMLRRSSASAATLHHSVASPRAIEAAHAVGAAVYVWTVDDAHVARRLVQAGADGIITNDPRIFGTFDL